MNPGENETDSTSLPKELCQQLPKHLAAYIITLFALILTGFLQAYGDALAHSLSLALGKKLLLQIAAILLCSLAYCIFQILKMKRNKLERWRGLYWKRGDPRPYCAFCYDKDQKRISLTHKKIFTERGTHEWWACYVCNHDFSARKGEDYEMTIVHQRIM